MERIVHPLKGSLKALLNNATNNAYFEQLLALFQAVLGLIKS